MSGFKMDDYVPVNERIAEFITAHPLGSLQSEIVELTDSRVTVKALAFRDPDDPRPGIGHSSLEIPGKTTFTRGSEIENAETSAWGRAIAALGFEVKRGVATAEEVRNKRTNEAPGRSERANGTASVREAAGSPATTSGSAHSLDPAAAAARERMLAAWRKSGVNHDVIEQMGRDVGIPEGEKGTAEQYDLIASMLGNEPAAAVAAEEASVTLSAGASNESTAVPTSGSSTPDAAVTEAAGVPPASAASEPPQHGTPEYRAWFDAQPQSERMKLRAQGLGPSDRPKKAPVQPDAPEVAEQVGAAL